MGRQNGPVLQQMVHGSRVSTRELHEVWAWNLDAEFEALLAAVDREAGTFLALDTEFPGFIREEPRSVAKDVRYQALRENVDCLRPIQIGAAVAGADGTIRGVWSFNLRFNLGVDLHTQSSVKFLHQAGIDFARHASEGIEASLLGRRLAGSLLVGQHFSSPWWVTFSGSYDLGFLLKLLTAGRPLPRDAGAFEQALGAFVPRRVELRDLLPHGSLDSLGHQLRVARHGAAHTAGSDALLTLELYLQLLPWDDAGCWAYVDPWDDVSGTATAWPQRWPGAWECAAADIPWPTTSFAAPPPLQTLTGSAGGGAEWSQPWQHMRTSTPVVPRSRWNPGKEILAI